MSSPQFGFRKGDCFRFTQKPDFHLFVVISDPARNPDEVVLVNVTSVKPHTRDFSCRLAVGDHPWLRHDSVIAYQYARTETAYQLRGLIARDKVELEDPMPESTLNRIIDGAFYSPYMPACCYNTLLTQL